MWTTFVSLRRLSTPLKLSRQTSSTFQLMGSLISTLSFSIYIVQELRFFSYGYTTFFVDTQYFSHMILRNYFHNSFEYTFHIQDALGFVIVM